MKIMIDNPATDRHNFRQLTEMQTFFFDFEEDFVEDNVRCIPMIVRFKLDACGIKLKLSEWSKMPVEERNALAVMRCPRKNDVSFYRNYLQKLVLKYAGAYATDLPVEINPLWTNEHAIPEQLEEKLQAFSWHISLHQWRSLDQLQRFVLLKLCKPGHEHKNFPKAVKEFGLV